MYGIGHAFIKLHGTLPRIFFIGTSFYFVGSGLGFVFTTEIIENPFTNRIMKDWSFFTQTGILIEILFFTIGLTYRMRLVEMRKNNIEKELFYEKLKELEFQQNLMKQREHISHDLHDDVGSTLNSIAVYSEIVKQYVQQSSPEATQILNKICTASQDLISTLNDIVWAVNPKNDHFENITLRMRLFAADLLMNRNVKIDFEADERLNNVTLSIEKRKHFFLIYKEAVNNVYKYADCSELKVRIYDCTKNICMDIMDDGKGFDHHKNSDGNGLHTMDERAKLLGGDIEIKTSPGNGCKMSLCFPIV
jgi:signal transduction histidine kinase